MIKGILIDKKELQIDPKVILRFIAMMLMVTTYLPILTENLPPIIRSHHFWAPLWLLSLIIIAPKTYTNSLLLYIIILGALFNFILIDIIWPYTTEWNRLLVLSEYYILTVGLSIYAYFETYKDYEGAKLVAKWMLVFILITSILTIFTSFVDPMYARKLTGGDFSQSDSDNITKYGGGGYSYGVVFLLTIPIIIHLIQLKRNILFIIIYIIIIIAIIRMQFFANIILMIFISVIAYAITKIRNVNVVALIAMLILAILVILPGTVYISLLDMLIGLFSNESNIAFKLQEVKLLLVGDANEFNAVTLRASRYPMLYDAFMNNVIYGYYSTYNIIDIQLGAHLYWPNKIAIFGLFGSIPYLILYIQIIKHAKNQILIKYHKIYNITIITIIIFGFLKAIAGRQTWYYLFMLPYIIMYINETKERIYKNIQNK